MTSATTEGRWRSWTESILGRGPLGLRIANAVALVGLIGCPVYFATAGAHGGGAHAYWAADLADPYWFMAWRRSPYTILGAAAAAILASPKLFGDDLTTFVAVHPDAARKRDDGG